MSDQITKDLGGITAYAAAVAAGYTGTKAQFETLMASYATVAQNAAASASAAADSEENAEAWAVGERGGTPVSSGDDTYNNNAKYWAEQAEDFADSIDPDKIESHIDAAYIKETASGSIATFSDGAPAPVRNLIAEIVPLQSGSGDPSPSNVRAISGWTECNITVASIRGDARTYNNADNGAVTGYFLNSDGTTTANAGLNITEYIPAKGGDSITIETGSYENPSICFYDSNRNYISGEKYNYRTPVTTTAPNGCAFIRFTYANIEVMFEVVATTHTISFASAGTVYGGRLDVTSGVLVVDMVGILLDDAVFTYYSENFYICRDYAGIIKGSSTPGVPPNAIAEKYIVEGQYGQVGADRIKIPANGWIYSFTENPSGKLVCELATPQTYQLAPTEVKTLLKNNNIWADTGDVTVEYVADTKLYIDKKLAEL